MPQEFQHNEKELFIRIAGGDDEAFSYLFDQYWNRIYSIALAYIKSPELAEDCTQDTFLTLWKKRATLPGIESLEDYLFVITRNLVFKALRKKGVSYPIGEYLENTVEEQAGTPEKALSFKQLRELIQKAVSLLPPQQKQAWQLSRDQDLSHDEIAITMRLSKNTVKNHIVKALNFIRNYIQSHSDILLPVAIGLLLWKF